MYRSLACVFFYDLNLARLTLKISPKCQSSKNVSLHSRSFIVQFLSLLSGWLSSRFEPLISDTFYDPNLTRVSPRIFIWDWHLLKKTDEKHIQNIHTVIAEVMGSLQSPELIKVQQVRGSFSSIHRQKQPFKNNCRGFKEKENTVKSFHELEGICFPALTMFHSTKVPGIGYKCFIWRRRMWIQRRRMWRKYRLSRWIHY